MSISGGPGVQVSGPTCTPAKFGLFSVAEVEDRDFGHWLDGSYHDQLSCDDLLVVSKFCEPHFKGESAAGVTHPEADPFTVVAGYQCSTGGDTLAVAWDRAEQRLIQGEQRSVELTFWTGSDTNSNPIRQSLGQNADVVDLTPGTGTVSITTGVALLENWAGQNMACQPIIHAARGIATYLRERNLLLRDGDVMRMDATDSRVAVGGGYLVGGPAGSTMAAGEGWLYITGSIKILRSPSFFTPERDDEGAAVDRVLNDVAVFAERSYSISMECGIAAVRVNLKSCCC